MTEIDYEDQFFLAFRAGYDKGARFIERTNPSDAEVWAAYCEYLRL